MNVKPNSNFHQVSKGSVFDVRREKEFLEYRSRWNGNPKTYTIEGFPIHLDIESTNACNLRCPFCATTYNYWGDSSVGRMSVDLYKRIIDQGVEHGLCSIKLSLRGEPLLHNQLPEMIAYAKKRGILDVYFNTNAMLLNDEVSRKLIDSGLDRISISFEGIEKEAYEKYRPGAKYETVVENIEKLMDLKRKTGAEFPKVRVQTVLLDELKKDFSKYVDFWEKRVDEVAYLDAREEGPQFDHRGLIANWACPFLWQRMTILWDGVLLPCLMHGLSDFSLMSLGNVKEKGIAYHWRSEKLNEIRELHKRGLSHKIEACDRCSYHALEVNKLKSCNL